MFPPASAGPPPPDVRGAEPSMPPPMPASLIADQGQKARKQDQGQLDELSKKTVEMGVTKLMEMKNAIDGLSTTMRALDPSSDALLVPLVAAWQGIAQKMKEVIGRASSGQPNLAGMQPGAGGAAAGSPDSPGAAGAAGTPGPPPDQAMNM